MHNTKQSTTEEKKCQGGAGCHGNIRTELSSQKSHTAYPAEQSQQCNACGYTGAYFRNARGSFRSLQKGLVYHFPSFIKACNVDLFAYIGLTNRWKDAIWVILIHISWQASDFCPKISNTSLRQVIAMLHRYTSVSWAKTHSGPSVLASILHILPQPSNKRKASPMVPRMETSLSSLVPMVMI